MSKTDEVIAELKRRAARGRPLNSGANRGDWLYAAALIAFGSWENAVEAAGFSYDAIKIRPLNKEEVIARLKAVSASGDPILSNAQEPKVASAAVRLFGSWREATKAAGGLPGPTKWTSQRVVDAIRADLQEGLPVNSLAVVRRNGNLYAAGRRRFGSWAAALEAESGQPDPIVALVRAERGRRRPMDSVAVRSRNPRLHVAAIARFGSWEGALRAAFGIGDGSLIEVEAPVRSRRKG